MGDQKKIPAGMEPLPDLAERRSREQREREQARRAARENGSNVRGMQTPFPVFGNGAGETGENGNPDEQQEEAEEQQVKPEEPTGGSGAAASRADAGGAEPEETGGQPEPQAEAEPEAEKTGGIGTAAADGRLPGRRPADRGRRSGHKGRAAGIGIAVAVCAAAAAGVLVLRSGGNRGSAGGNGREGTAVAVSAMSTEPGAGSGVSANAEVSGATAAAARAETAENANAGSSERAEKADGGYSETAGEAQEQQTGAFVWPAGDFKRGEDQMKLPALRSTAALVVDADTGYRIAEKLPAGDGTGAAEPSAEKDTETAVRVPETMTDLLTLTAVCRGAEDAGAGSGDYAQQPVVIRQDLVAAAEAADLPVAGFTPGETVTLQDCLYGMILANGAEARGAVQELLASGMDFDAAAGQSAGAEGHNTKKDAAPAGAAAAAEAGNAENGCVEVIAASLAAALQQAMKDTEAQKILSADSYTTSATAEHPAGLVLTGTFLQRIRQQELPGVNVLAARSGYAEDAGACAVSLSEVEEGSGVRRILCVTGGAENAWQSVYDLRSILQEVSKRN